MGSTHWNETNKMNDIKQIETELLKIIKNLKKDPSNQTYRKAYVVVSEWLLYLLTHEEN